MLGRRWSSTDHKRLFLFSGEVIAPILMGPGTVSNGVFVNQQVDVGLIDLQRQVQKPNLGMLGGAAAVVST